MACGSCGKQPGVGQIVRGAIGLAKSELGIGTAISAEQIAARRSVCESCDRWDHGRCMECGCYTYAKTRLTHERCPLGKWGAAT
jgi:hypothetical protein